VALSKGQKDSGGPECIVKQAYLKKKLVGKTADELQSERGFKKLELTLRSRTTGNLVRVYNTTGLTDFLGAKYCVVRFDASDQCEDIRFIGVPASTKKDPL